MYSTLAVPAECLGVRKDVVVPVLRRLLSTKPADVGVLEVIRTQLGGVAAASSGVCRSRASAPATDADADDEF